MPVAFGASVSIDEPAWITSALVTLDLYRSAAGPSRWQDAYDAKSLGDWGHKNPPVGKLVLGLALAPFVEPADARTYAWDWRLSAEENAKTGRLPPPHLLLPARAATLAAALACLALAYALVVLLTKSAWLALACSFALSLMPTVEYLAVHVHTDAIMLALALGSLVLLLRALDAGRLQTIVAAGACAGLAGATKLSAGAIAAGLLVAIAATGSDRRSASLRTLVAAAAIGIAFVLPNPYLYPNPIVRTADLATQWSASKREQQTDPALAPTAVHSTLRGLALTTVRGIFRPGHPRELHRGHWSALAEKLPVAGGWVALALGCLYLAGHRARISDPRRSLGLPLGVALGACALELALLGSLTPSTPLSMLGIVVPLATPAESALAGSRRRAFLLVYFVTWCATSLWLPFDWARYYLPVIALACVSWSLGLSPALRATSLERVTPSLVGPRLRPVLEACAALSGVLAILWLAAR